MPLFTVQDVSQIHKPQNCGPLKAELVVTVEKLFFHLPALPEKEAVKTTARLQGQSQLPFSAA